MPTTGRPRRRQRSHVGSRRRTCSSRLRRTLNGHGASSPPRQAAAEWVSLWLVREVARTEVDPLTKQMSSFSPSPRPPHKDLIKMLTAKADGNSETNTTLRISNDPTLSLYTHAKPAYPLRIRSGPYVELNPATRISKRRAPRAALILGATRGGRGGVGCRFMSQF